jgi:hypothetical protein
MKNVIAERMTAEVEGDFVVFLIGMRINKIWKIHKWLPVFLAMPRMIKELQADPESGFLGHLAGISVTVQYWRSFEDLEAYARSKDKGHWPAWVNFNQMVSNSRDDVGIWHETYKIRAGEYETIYSGMPVVGLGAVGKLFPISERRDSARGRLAGSSRLLIDNPHTKVEPGSTGDRATGGDEIHAGFGDGADRF